MVRDSLMEPGTEERASIAGELCEKGLWREVLAFVQKWREDKPVRLPRAYYYLGVGLDRVAPLFRRQKWRIGRR